MGRLTLWASWSGGYDLTGEQIPPIAGAEGKQKKKGMCVGARIAIIRLADRSASQESECKCACRAASGMRLETLSSAMSLSRHVCAVIGQLD